jgi:hypothetical protein
MLKRLRKLWQLTRKDPKALAQLETLTDEQLAVIPDEGDGKAVFLGSGTEEEYLEMQREDEGMKGWYERLKNL